jgi:membrane-bound lytic murein transglycosylase B
VRGLLLALGCALLAVPLARQAAANGPSYAERPEVQAFILEVSARHGFAEEELLYLFSRVQRTEPVLEAIQPPPPKARSWEEYRGNFVNPRRIAAGQGFWKTHRRALARAERRYGVPAEYIVAIIGVETFYGRYAGRWRVVDALTTLAFDYPPRAPYFREELEQYLLLARDAGVDVFSMRGSYAGAVGIPQFMPGSSRRYAVDFDGNGRVDLLRSAADAIGSVANYLRAHGWQPGAEVMRPAQVSGEGWRAYAGIEPRHSLKELAGAGISVGEVEGAAAVLVELESPQRPSEVRVGFHNFYVLTRYNRSAFYASAVHDLAVELKRAYDLGR